MEEAKSSRLFPFKISLAVTARVFKVLNRGKSSEDTFYRHAKIEKPAVKELQE